MNRRTFSQKSSQARKQPQPHQMVAFCLLLWTTVDWSNPEGIGEGKGLGVNGVLLLLV